MGKTPRKLLTSLLASSLLLASSQTFAKQTEIGVGAIVVDTSLLGKGEFNTNDTLIVQDQIITKSEGSTTILFNDESMLTLGPNAHAHITVYDEGDATRPGQSHIRIIKGTFRFFFCFILENGGAQFVIAGNKAIGATNGKLKPVFVSKKNQSDPDASQSDSNTAPEIDPFDQADPNGETGSDLLAATESNLTSPGGGSPGVQKKAPDFLKT